MATTTCLGSSTLAPSQITRLGLGVRVRNPSLLNFTRRKSRMVVKATSGLDKLSKNGIIDKLSKNGIIDKLSKNGIIDKLSIGLRSLHHNRKFGFLVKAEKDGGIDKESVLDKAEEEARGQSTMPDRFRPLTKEAPDMPVRWPWFIALAFALYTWRTVLWEISNWKKAVVAIVGFLGYISKLALALVFLFIGDPITSLIRGCETTFYTIRAYYSWVINYAPIQELTTIIILSSAVFAISEATVPDSVNSQPYLLTLAGLIGFAAVRTYITELCFWILLLGLFSFSHFVKKRDYVSSAMPVAAVLAAVGEPWIRILVLSSFLTLAIYQHSKQPSIGTEEGDTGIVKRVPIPLLCAALAIGLRIAAKWAGYRHLTWMIV